MVNVRKRYSEFLGFKIRVRPKSRKYIVQSHICDKVGLEGKGKSGGTRPNEVPDLQREKTAWTEIRLYNSMVLGIQNYFNLPPHRN